MVMATDSQNMHAPIQCFYCHRLVNRSVSVKKRLYQGNHWTPSHKVTAVTHPDASDMALTSIAPSPSTLSPTEIETLIHQVISKSNLNIAMATTLGTFSWFIDSACCNHMTPDSFLFPSNLFYVVLPIFTLLMVHI
jgi:hypothetical protein